MRVPYLVSPTSNDVSQVNNVMLNLVDGYLRSAGDVSLVFDTTSGSHNSLNQYRQVSGWRVGIGFDGAYTTSTRDDLYNTSDRRIDIWGPDFDFSSVFTPQDCTIFPSYSYLGGIGPGNIIMPWLFQYFVRD